MMTSPAFSFPLRSLLPALVVGALACAGPVRAATDHAHHGHHGTAAMAAAPSTQAAKKKSGTVPALKIVLPQAGATVGSQLAVVFKTDADISKVTMGAAQPAIHLHLDTAGVSVMPTASQLMNLGGGHYLFVFEVPLAPGERTLQLSWADDQHRTITSSVREVKIRVAKDRAATP